MPVIQREVAVAAGGVEENLLAGSAFEFLRSRSVVSMAIVSSDNTSNTFCTIQIGSRVVAEEFVPRQGTTYPDTDNAFYYNAGGLPNERMVVRARNATAGSETFRIIAQVTEV